MSTTDTPERLTAKGRELIWGNPEVDRAGMHPVIAKEIAHRYNTYPAMLEALKAGADKLLDEVLSLEDRDHVGFAAHAASIRDSVLGPLRAAIALATPEAP